MKTCISRIALCALTASALPAYAETEAIFIGNAANNDSTYFSFSIRHDVSTNSNGIFKIRGDLARGDFSFGFNGGTTDGSIQTARLLLGYAWPQGNTTFTGYLGPTYRIRDYSPGDPVLEEVDEVGVFASLEASIDSEMGHAFEALVEYDSVMETIYASSYYLVPVGGEFLLGPSANYLDEGDYSRWAAGLRGSVMVAPTTELSISAMYAEGGTDGFGDEDSSYIEFQLLTNF